MQLSWRYLGIGLATSAVVALAACSPECLDDCAATISPDAAAPIAEAPVVLPPVASTSTANATTSSRSTNRKPSKPTTSSKRSRCRDDSGLDNPDGECALQAGQEHTGMTRAECIADSEAGNAS